MIRNELKDKTRVITFNDVMAMTGFSKSYLYKLVAQHKIPYGKPSGRKLFFDRERVEEWLLSTPVTPVEADVMADKQRVLKDYMDA